MSKARAADNKPLKIELEAGEYYWCSCGRSDNQPFCDGSHAGTDFKPLAFTIKEKTESWICLCKKTGTPPFCDGTHRALSPNKTDQDPQPS